MWLALIQDDLFVGDVRKAGRHDLVPLGFDPPHNRDLRQVTAQLLDFLVDQLLAMEAGS